jgi:hypothetical protein
VSDLDMLPLKSVARILDVCTLTASRYTKRAVNPLRAVRLNGKSKGVFVARKELVRWLESHSGQAGQAAPIERKRLKPPEGMTTPTT